METTVTKQQLDKKIAEEKYMGNYLFDNFLGINGLKRKIERGYQSVVGHIDEVLDLNLSKICEDELRERKNEFELAKVHVDKVYREVIDEFSNNPLMSNGSTIEENYDNLVEESNSGGMFGYHLKTDEDFNERVDNLEDLVAIGFYGKKQGAFTKENLVDTLAVFAAPTLTSAMFYGLMHYAIPESNVDMIFGSLSYVFAQSLMLYHAYRSDKFSREARDDLIRHRTKYLDGVIEEYGLKESISNE